MWSWAINRKDNNAYDEHIKIVEKEISTVKHIVILYCYLYHIVLKRNTFCYYIHNVVANISSFRDNNIREMKIFCNIVLYLSCWICYE